MPDGCDCGKDTVDHLSPGLRLSNAGSYKVGESIAVYYNALARPLHDVNVHVSTWVEWPRAGVEVIKLLGESGQGRAEGAFRRDGVTDALNPESNEVSLKCSLKLSW